jgi:hypothetical protein
MYDTSPDHHLALAELLARANADMDSPHLRAEAIAHYREALRLNDARPGTDEVRRWSAQRTAEIRQRLQDLEAGAARPASAPAADTPPEER